MIKEQRGGSIGVRLGALNLYKLVVSEKTDTSLLALLKECSTGLTMLSKLKSEYLYSDDINLIIEETRRRFDHKEPNIATILEKHFYNGSFCSVQSTRAQILFMDSFGPRVQMGYCYSPLGEKQLVHLTGTNSYLTDMTHQVDEQGLGLKAHSEKIEFFMPSNLKNINLPINRYYEELSKNKRFRGVLLYNKSSKYYHYGNTHSPLRLNNSIGPGIKPEYQYIKITTNKVGMALAYKSSLNYMGQYTIVKSVGKPGKDYAVMYKLLNL